MVTHVADWLWRWFSGMPCRNNLRCACTECDLHATSDFALRFYALTETHRVPTCFTLAFAFVSLLPKSCATSVVSHPACMTVHRHGGFTAMRMRPPGCCTGTDAVTDAAAPHGVIRPFNIGLTLNPEREVSPSVRLPDTWYPCTDFRLRIVASATVNLKVVPFSASRCNE